MPAVIDPFACDKSPACPAKITCKYRAIKYDVVKRRINIQHDLCGKCPGPCQMSCDRNAIKWAPLGHSFDELRARYDPIDIF